MCSGNPMRNAQAYASQYQQPQTSAYPQSGMSAPSYGTGTSTYGMDPNSAAAPPSYGQNTGFVPPSMGGQPASPGGYGANTGINGGMRTSPYGSTPGPDYYSMDPSQQMPQGQIPNQQAMSAMASSPMAGGVMSSLARNPDGSVNINDYGSMWQMAGGADTSGMKDQSQQQLQGMQYQNQAPQDAGQPKTETAPPPSFYNFGPPTRPTYLNGMTALLYGGPNGPKAPPTDNRMVWNMGGFNGQQPGYQLVNGYNGYTGS